MKAYILIPMAAGLLFAGCGKSSSSTDQSTATNATPNYANGNPITVVPDYLGAVGQAQQYSIKQIDLSYLHEAIEQYNAANGHYPKTLQELVPNWIGKIPQAPNGCKIDYDPNKGTVKVVKQ
jgi:hypothetical protein